ncbi:ABC transporter permease [Streptomyces sp. NPDC048825]|uniref:ABC transporter permease n=1 Tax=Streptomyces sp. NPDC048825 TaxID=3365592 RepID=UPI00371D431A
MTTTETNRITGPGAVRANARGGSRGIRRRVTALALGWGFAALLLGLWEVAGRADTTALLPPFSVVATELVDLITGDALMTDIVPSLARALAGFVIGSLAGVVLGVALGWWRGLEPWCRAGLEFLRAVPAPALLPLAILAFGASDTTRIGVIALGAVWPVLLNTTDGVRRVEAGYIDSARVYARGGRAELLRRVVLPAATPQIMAGLRVGLALSLIMMVISEMIASSSGLGNLILRAQRLYALDQMYAGVLLLGVLGWLLTLLFSAVERRALAWFYGLKGQDR